MVNYEESKSFSNFVGFELLVFCSFLTWLAVSKFEWNGIETFVISFVILIIVLNTRVYHVFSIIFSIAWGIAGYLLLSFLVSETGGESTLSIVIGVVGFILGALLSFGGRSLGKQYYYDIEVDK